MAWSILPYLAVDDDEHSSVAGSTRLPETQTAGVRPHLLVHLLVVFKGRDRQG